MEQELKNFGLHKEDDKEPVPQINSKTGLSMDYGNQYHFLGIAFRLYNGGIQAVKDWLKHTGTYLQNPAPPFYMKYYEDVYKDYSNIITDKNRESVKKLNEFADRMNEITRNPDTLNEEDFREVYDALDALIYGDTKSNLPSIEK